MKMITLRFLLPVLMVSFGDSAKPDSCVGRCGETFSRAQLCSCDLQCSAHNECCQDFQAVCPSVNSCRGRCAEPFVRGRLCNCDPQCVQFNTCCPDYRLQCDARVSSQKGPVTARRGRNGRRRSNSESEERFNVRHPCRPGSKCVVVAPARHVTTHVQAAQVAVPPVYTPPLQRDIHMVVSHSGVAVARPNLGLFAAPAPLLPNLPHLPHLSHLPLFRPRPFHEIAAALGLPVLPQRALVDDLCSDQPINGLTALGNGTIVIFKGESFWTVDPVTHHLSRPLSISKVLGVPAYIDTVFTRSNCEGDVYIFKESLYWRLDRNLVLEPGFPKPLSYEFPGLTPGLTAALSTPATVSRRESVYFFRRGEIMQHFTFPSSNIPACSPAGIMKTAALRQTEVLLSEEIHIKVSMKDFPVPVTAALTAPIPMKIDQYEYYVFSGPLYHSVSVAEELPAVVGPDHPAPVVLSTPVAVETSITEVVTVISDPPPPENSLKVWLQCHIYKA